MPNYFTELKDGPSGSSYKVKDEEAHSSIEALINDISDVETALAEKADTEDIPDLVSDNLAKGILGNETVLSTDTVPFVSKIMGAGKYQRKKFVGCSFVWNQLVDSDTESVTIASGHKYALYQNGAWSIGASSGTAIAVTGGSDLLTDLTQLFGSTAIADYIYNLEQATAGAGVAKLKELGFFTEDYYAYDAGSVQSVNIKEYSVTGKNLLDKSTLGWYEVTAVGSIRYGFKSIKLPAGSYVFNYSDNHGIRWYITNVTNNYSVSTVSSVPFTFTLDEESEIIVRTAVEQNPSQTPVIDEPQLELGSTATEYEPYHKTTYTLTPTELRGVPKIDANNNIYCAGDEYASDGEVTRKYVIVDLGTLDWSGTTTFYISSNSIGLKRPDDSNGKTAFKGICSKYRITSYVEGIGNNGDKSIYTTWASSSSSYLYIRDSSYSNVEDFKAAMSGVYLVYEKATPTTETLTPFDYPQSVGSLEEIVDYKVEQEQRDVAIPTGHVTEYMGKGGEFTLPTLPETPSVLAFDGHNAYWNKNVIDIVNALVTEIETAWNGINHIILPGRDLTVVFANEISNYSDEWAWIQARLNANDLRGLRIGDYIPIKIAANGNIASETHKAEIAGINTYRRTGDTGYEVGYHIDWITRDCYSGMVQFNTGNNNNGTGAGSMQSPFLASNLKSWLDGTLYGLLDAKLKAVIKSKRILAPYRYQSGATLADDNSWGWEDFTKLWVPLETEIFDCLVWSTKGFGNGQAVQYPIFANNYTHRIKGAGPGGARAAWCTASAYSGNSTYVVLVNGHGRSDRSNASNAYRMPVCFRTMEA